MDGGLMADPTVAVVTGGTTGIGLACATRLAAAGHHVLVVGRDAARGAEALARIDRPRTTKFIAADVATEEGRSRIVDAADQHGGIAVLVNNAGTWQNELVEDVTEQSWDVSFDVNVKALFFLVQAALPSMRAAHAGRIVNIASIAGLQGAPASTVYCATKGAVIALTKALAAELGPQGINVNAVAPGTVPTAFNEHLLSQPGYGDRLLERTPARRHGTPEDIAGAVAFLASPDASWMHGECVVVDGGWIAA
jgi:NAD(P)-dependent dehydrogenase (short-subunit alcohol dehydrogenase family)